jgi:NADP-dependent 3-hydroxy acid dehydrogenase YdfG
MGLLEGRVAVVTGLEDLVDEFGARVVTVSGNVTDFASNVRVVDAAVKRFDFVDVFVGNAGIYDNRSVLADISGERLGALSNRRRRVWP